MATTLVTGGAGFLGAHVVTRLLARGTAVVVLDDLSNGKRAHLAGVADHHRLRVIVGDITDAATVRSSMADCDTVIHLAVLGLRQSLSDPRRVNRVIVDGTLNLLESARDANIDLFLNCSSSETYGSAIHVPMSEDHPLNPETPYAAAKIAQDMYVRSFGQTHGLPWVTLRPFNMYGPHSHWQGVRGELIPKMIVRALNGAPLLVFGDGSQTRDFTYVEDAADLILAVADRPDLRTEVFNVCTGKETRVCDIAQAICQACGRDPATAIEYGAARPGDVRRHLGDPGKLRLRLGRAPETPLEIGLARTIEWMTALPEDPATLLRQETARNWERTA